MQSMTNTPPGDAVATAAQVLELAEAGCDLVRVAVPDMDAVLALREVRRLVPDVPLVADVHFDARIAVAVAPYVDKIRLNPGTIRGRKVFAEVAAAIRDHGIPLRIGANSGSLPPALRRDPRPMGERLCDAVADWVARFEDAGCVHLVVSVKASNVMDTIDAFRAAAVRFPYPLHVGVTEAGTPRSGSVRSAVALGVLLGEGIGDTIRVSLAGDPVEEVRVGLEILRSLGLRPEAGRLVACPTCGRSRVDTAQLAARIEPLVDRLATPAVVAIMGCEVNGPGEAKGADWALVGTPGGAAILRRGRVVFQGGTEAAVVYLEEALSRILGE
jgi:(E)-4-hydroxy-3-methylbut-2-enyl-diphosphate synthase